MDLPSPSRRELEAAWQCRVERARAHYKEESKQLSITIAAHEPLSELNPDGGFAIRRAIHKESEALREYSRVLKIFTDLVVRQVVPDEDP
jgi:hypothetical protein